MILFDIKFIIAFFTLILIILFKNVNEKKPTLNDIFFKDCCTVIKKAHSK